MGSEVKDDEESLTYTRYIAETVSGYISGLFAVEEEESCSQCPAAQEMYCVECDKVFCKPCAIRAHHPGQSNDAHSLEEIEEEGNQGVQIITPLLEEFLLVSVLFFVFKHTLIGQDYLHSGNVCIITNTVRKQVSMFDDKAFYLVKTSLATYCDIEDSYWRLFLDFWVRDVVTDSDSIFLLAMSFLSAMLFRGAVVLIFVPILAVIYGVVFATISKAEALLPPVAPLKFLQRIVKKLNVVDFGGDAGDCPPVTKRRFRPAMNYMDFAWYEQNRIFREFTHFFSATGEVLQKMLTLPMYFVVVVRAFCIIFSLGPVLNKLTSLVVPGLVQAHHEWFLESSSDEYTDRFVRFITRSFVGLGAAGIDESKTLLSAINGLGAFSALTSRYLLVPLFIVGFLKFRYCFETWKFNKQWEGGVRESVRGRCPMGSGCKCECVQHLCGKE